jgi:hypothetical protein
MEFVYLYELLQVVDRLFEYNAGGHLTNEVIAHAHERKFSLFFKLRVVHRKIDYLFIVYNGNQLSPGKKGLIVLNSKEVPAVGLKFLNKNAV